MTPRQEFTIAVIGGMAGALAAALITVTVLVIVAHVIERRQDRRHQRSDLDTCQAIDALGTTTHPKE